MSSVPSARSPRPGGAWWWKWVAILAGTGAFAWALAAVLHGGPSAGRAQESGGDPGPTRLEPSRPVHPRESFWDEWDDGDEDADEDQEGWEEEDDGPLASRLARPTPYRPTPDARSRPS